MRTEIAILNSILKTLKVQQKLVDR